MKFIFPQNYDFKLKLFGFIDYPIAIFNLILWIVLYFIINAFIPYLYVKICVFISICFPVFLLSIIGFNHENLFYVLMYIFKFMKNKKLYLYIKDSI